MQSFLPDLKTFINTAQWTFAVTYAATWPHYYLVRKRVDSVLFEKLVEHIREHGYRGWFYKMEITYFDEDGYTYWTMAQRTADGWNYPVEKEEIINRCGKEETYESRLKAGTLPN